MITDLEKFFESPDVDVRREAVLKAGACDQPGARPACARLLLRALADQNWRVRKAAVEEMIENFEPDEYMDGLEALLYDDENAGARNSAIEAFIRLGPKATARLTRAFTTDNADVRKFIIDIIGEVRDRDSVPLLLDALKYPDQNVVAAAVEHLGAMKEASVVDALVELLDSGDLWTSYPALDALGNIGDVRAVPAIIKTLQDKRLKEPAIRALGKLADASELDHITPHIADHSKAVQHEALCALEAMYARGVPEAEISESLRRHFGDRVVELLLEYARSAKDDIRATSILFLGLLRDERALGPLIRMSEDDRHADEVRRALVYIGRKSPDALAKLIEDRSSVETRFLCNVMAEVASPVYFDVFAGLLGHDDGHVRSYSARGLANIGDERAVPLLMPRLDDQYEDVQDSVVSALGVLRDALDSQALLELIKNKNPVIRRNAVRLLGLMENPDTAGALSFALKDDVPGVRMAAVGALTRLRNEEAFESLILALADEDQRIRAAAVSSLGRTGLKRFDQKIRLLLEDSHPMVRAAACRALGGIDGKGSVMYLVRMLRDEDGFVVANAIDALGRLGGSEARSALTAMLSHADKEVRRSAIMALAGYQGIEERLLAFIDNPDWATRSAAVEALKEHRQDFVRGRLERALETENDPVVRKALEDYLSG